MLLLRWQLRLSSAPTLSLWVGHASETVGWHPTAIIPSTFQPKHTHTYVHTHIDNYTHTWAWQKLQEQWSFLLAWLPSLTKRVQSHLILQLYTVYIHTHTHTLTHIPPAPQHFWVSDHHYTPPSPLMPPPLPHTHTPPPFTMFNMPISTSLVSKQLKAFSG